MTARFDKIASLLFFIIGVLFFTEALKISDSAYGSSVGPKIFPMGLGIALIALSILLIIESFKKKAEAKASEESLSSPQYKRFFIILGAAITYVVLLEPLGYLITTFAFLFVTFQTLERGKWLSSLIIAAAFSGVIYFGFVYILGGSLPGFPI
ncbi:tripartite tricarboxylate transporter TctB family protein [Chryseomicrobium palamuruense]|uniref:Tripartite tricarboxylate transporter TctB family protein n=1 Tax=Chryseomicrobium palamuruense TaxID=682973 RepID=A0ABV8USN6_9BACL